MAAEIDSVLLDAWARDHDIAAVQRAFGRAGFDVEAQRGVEDRVDWGAAALPWLVYVTLAVPFTRFFAAFGSAAGQDAWGSVKTWVGDIWAAHKDPVDLGGTLTVTDTRGNRLVLPPNLPDEALDTLAAVDWDAHEGGDLRWDPDQREWRDALRP